MAPDDWEDRLLRWLKDARVWYALAWVGAVLGGGIALATAWGAFDNGRVGAQRRDGNGGHATIDFGGQWLMGRMLVTGNGRQLYNRNVQREVLRPAYPDGDGEPGRTDVENLMFWVMGRDDPKAAEAAASFVAPLAARDPLGATALTAAADHDAEPRLDLVTTKRVGGPLYPPINAFVYAPLGALPPRLAYRLQQGLNVALVFVAAFGLSYLSRGRIWCPVAAGLLFLYPGFAGSINLGQNATLTLAILVWGWALLSRGREALGGCVWGLLAFKPVWALAFFLVPVLTRRWRMALGMGLTGALAALATLPVVGLSSWLDWLAVGREAAQLYNVEENWIFLSRDLLSIPRRWLFDFKATTHAEREKEWLRPALLGWALLALVLEVTARLVVLRWRQAARAIDGPPAAVILLGAWMLCYHFMYYDVLLTALPVFLLFTEPQRYLIPLRLVIAPVRSAPDDYHRPAPLPDKLPLLPPMEIEYRSVWVLNRLAPTMVVFLVATQHVFPYVGLGSYWGPPWDTFGLMALWLWCGWQWLRHGEKVASSWGAQR
jgi:hypothetical protein